MPPRDHQAVPRRHRIGIGDAQRQFVLQQHPAAGLQRAEHTTVLAMGVAGLQSAEVGATSCVGKQPSRLPALQRKQRACRLLRSSEPPLFLGTMWSTSRARWCGVCQATACPAAFAAALGAGEHPVFDQAADRGAVAAPVGEHLLAALLSEGIEALAAQLQQLFALGVGQLLAAHKVVGALVVAGDAVEGEPCPPSA